MERREERAFYLFISPWIIGFILFNAGPVLGSFVISFTQWSMLSAPSWTGPTNYQRLMNDPLFWQALGNTLYFAVGSVGLGLILALLLALLLNQQVKGMALFRTIFYLPSVCSGVAVAILWTTIFNPDFGLINSALHAIGIAGPQYLLYLYRTAFEDFDMGYASALAWVLFLILLAITLGQLVLARRWVYYEGGLKG
jgi:multiple sugar transport system permease protein